MLCIYVLLASQTRWSILHYLTSIQSLLYFPILSIIKPSPWIIFINNVYQTIIMDKLSKSLKLYFSLTLPSYFSSLEHKSLKSLWLSISTPLFFSSFDHFPLVPFNLISTSCINTNNALLIFHFFIFNQCFNCECWVIYFLNSGFIFHIKVIPSDLFMAFITKQLSKFKILLTFSIYLALFLVSLKKITFGEWMSFTSFRWEIIKGLPAPWQFHTTALIDSLGTSKG